MYLYHISGDIVSQEKNANIGIMRDADKKWCKFSVNHNSKFLLSGSKVNSKPVRLTKSNIKAKGNKNYKPSSTLIVNFTIKVSK